MNWKTLSTALILLAGLTLSQDAFAAGPSPSNALRTSSDPLDFAVALPQTTFSMGQPVPLTMTLRNLSAAPQLVNARLAVNDADAPAPYGEVSIQITLPSGDPAPFALDIRIGAPGQDDFAQLAPGGSVDTAARPADLAQLFSLTQSGDYVLTATYTNTVGGPTTFDDASAGFVTQDQGAWQGQVQSNTVTFHIQ